MCAAWTSRRRKLSKESKEKPDIKVTDKRIFTAEGDIREEFREAIHPSDPAVRPTPKPAEPMNPPEAKAQKPPQAPPPAQGRQQENDRGRTLADKATNPGTPFSNFIEPLIAQAYMSLGMLRNPYQPQTKLDPGAARQMIEILTLLQEKTNGNLTPDEDDFLSAHIGELKLAYVQRTKNVS
jgi:hypothetical protein